MTPLTAPDIDLDLSRPTPEMLRTWLAPVSGTSPVELMHPPPAKPGRELTNSGSVYAGMCLGLL